MRPFTTSRPLVHGFAAVHWHSRRWAGRRPGLETDVARVLAALEALERRTGQPVSLEVRSSGRFTLRTCEDINTGPDRSALVDCSFHTDKQKALLLFEEPPQTRTRDQFAPVARRRTLPASGTDRAVPVVLDLTERSREDEHAAQFIHTLFPHLTLHVEHSAAVDVRGVRTHTQTVSLRRLTHDDSLTAEEEDALVRFHGSAVGHGFHSTLARAMRTACAAIDTRYTRSADCAPATAQHADTSVLRLHLTLLAAHAPDAALRIQYPSETVSETATVHVVCDGSVLAEQTGSPLETPANVLKVLRDACRAVAPTEADALAQRLASRRVALVLPEQNISAKRTLLHLLDYYYGVPEAQLTLDTIRSAAGLFECRLHLSLQPGDWMATCADEPDVVLPLTCGTGLSKKAASETACATALHALFPDVCAEHLAPHPEFAALLAQSQVVNDGRLAPAVAQGLKAQLTWATGQCGGSWTCTARRLDERTDHPELGVSVHRAVWCATTTVSLGPDDAATPPAVHRLVAFDTRKSRAEQKSCAYAMAVCFPTQCHAAVNHAMASSLLTTEAKPPPCTDVEALPSEEDFREAVRCDVNLAALQELAPPFAMHLKGAVRAAEDTRRDDAQSLSLLETCEQCLASRAPDATLPLAGVADDPASAPRAVVETQFDHAKSHFTATVSSAAPSAGERACFAAHHWSMWAARLAACRLGVQHTAAGEGGTSAQLSALVDALPAALSRTTPLQDVVTAARQLYGVHVALRAVASSAGSEPPMVVVELWGTTVATDMDQPVLLADSATFPSVGSHSPTAALLARAAGHSPTAAALKCCRLFMTYHVRPVRDAFPKEVLHTQSVLITGWQRGAHAALPNLLSKVRDDVQRAAQGEAVSAACGVDGFAALLEVVSDSAGRLAELHFKVRSDTATVTLEVVTSPDILSALAELEERIRAEIEVRSTHGASSSQRSGRSFNTFEDAARSAVSEAFGLSIAVDSSADTDRWHCELSLDLGEGILYSLCRATADRQSDAVELAASHVLGVLRTQSHREAASVIGRTLVPETTTGEVVATGVLFRRLP